MGGENAARPRLSSFRSGHFARPLKVGNAGLQARLFALEGVVRMTQAGIDVEHLDLAGAQEVNVEDPDGIRVVSRDGYVARMLLSLIVFQIDLDVQVLAPCLGELQAEGAPAVGMRRDVAAPHS